MIMHFKYSNLVTLLVLTSFEIVHQVHSIVKDPIEIEGYIGGKANFMWNMTNQKKILSVSWGIRKGDIPYPQFINVNGYNGKVNLNKDLDDTIKERVSFHGNLTKGFVLFVLKNLTVNDTNEYIASMSDKDGVLTYPARLMVRTAKPTTRPSLFTDTSVASQSTPTSTAAYNKTTNSQDITTPEPRSANTVRHVNGQLMLATIALVMWHF